MKKFLSGLGVVLFLLVISGGLIFLFGKEVLLQNRRNLVSPKPPPTLIPIRGKIQGSLSYPSEGIPASLKVCALNLADQSKYCTSEHLKGTKEQYQYGLGYELRVPPGKYQVYAFLPDHQELKAYYTEFVTCGQKTDCPSHLPIDVLIQEGTTAAKIDPADWYTPPSQNPN